MLNIDFDIMKYEGIDAAVGLFVRDYTKYLRYFNDDDTRGQYYKATVHAVIKDRETKDLVTFTLRALSNERIWALKEFAPNAFKYYDYLFLDEDKSYYECLDRSVLEAMMCIRDMLAVLLLYQLELKAHADASWGQGLFIDETHRISTLKTYSEAIKNVNPILSNAKQVNTLRDIMDL